MPPIKKHIMDKQEQAATAAAASTNIAGGPQTPQLHDHAQVLQEAASALKSLHDGESSESSSPTSSKRSSAVAPAGAGVNPGNAGVALQTAVEAAFASTSPSAASSSKKNKTTDDGSGGANADGGGSGNPKKRKQIDGPSTDTAANNITSQFDEEIPLTFPQRLMELLDDEGNDDIIGWLPHGRGFLIYQKRRFAAELMGKYFKQSKFTSFTRKLNRWGFTRISRGPETGAYYHPYFRKGNARLCLQMTCQSLKGGPSGAIGTGAGAGTGEATVTVASNTAPPSMLQHQEASAAAAQLAVPKAAQIQQPIAPAPGLPMAAALVPNTTSTAPTGPSSSAAELLRTETATESVLRLRQLQRQQEQLMIRQRQIREEIQAISAALPEKIAQERRQQQVMVAAASTTAASASASAAAAGQAGQIMASAATPNATQATPPSGSTGTAPAPSSTTQGQDPAYSKAIVDAAIETLKRSNANSYLTLLMARQQQQQQQGAKQAGTASGPIAPAPAMATPAAATPATAAAAGAPPTNFQSQLRQTVRAQLDEMRLAESQRRQQPVQPAQQGQQAQQTNRAMEGITLTNDGRLKAGPGALHPAQAAAQSGTYRSGSQGQKRPSGAKRASAA